MLIFFRSIDQNVLADIVMISLGKEVPVWEECGGEESVRGGERGEVGVQCVYGDSVNRQEIFQYLY